MKAKMTIGKKLKMQFFKWVINYLFQGRKAGFAMIVTSADILSRGI
jgi:hypothetical protein